MHMGVLCGLCTTIRTSALTFIKIHRFRPQARAPPLGASLPSTSRAKGTGGEVLVNCRSPFLASECALYKSPAQRRAAEDLGLFINGQEHAHLSASPEARHCARITELGRNLPERTGLTGEVTRYSTTVPVPVNMPKGGHSSTRTRGVARHHGRVQSDTDRGSRGRARGW